MGRRMTYILLGIIVLAVGVFGVLILPRLRGGAPAATPAPKTVKIVVAVQTIPRGGEIVSGTVALREWPQDSLPPQFLVDVAEALGRYARFDIPKGLPIWPDMLADTEKAALFAPSDIPKQIPSGKVAVALPVTKLSSAAYAVKAGDRVDVLASFAILDLDEEFQTRLVNQYLAVATDEEGRVTFLHVDPGGRDRNPVLGFPAIEQPKEAQRPRLVVQLTVQNMQVLGVGDWLEQAPPTELAPAATPAKAPAGAQKAVPTAAPAPVKTEPPEIITVVVDPQDALVLKFMREAGAMMDLALRSVEDAAAGFATESVTLQYMFTRFGVAQPPKLPYGLDPRFPPTPTPDTGK